ncbi:MAG: abc transporter [Verrucomicrobiales bacterium]|nr:abc transporter [Verrucomicrobiales bacterium]
MLTVSNLRVHFPVKGGVLLRSVAVCKAVDGVSLTLREGETLGIIGESGCGKTTLGKAIAGLAPITAGSVAFAGHETGKTSARALARVRQMIFQDPAESLNQRHPVSAIVSEPFEIHGIGTPAERRQRTEELLRKVGLPAGSGDRYPFEFSGGQRQRIGIARAIALEPRLIICDEPVSALDVSVQSQVLNLMMELQRDMGLSYLFISHNLAVVKHVSNRIAIMYLGRIMELAPAEEIHRNPLHAYTRTLLAAIPVPDPSVRHARLPVSGDVPSPINPPPGCAFGARMRHPRYPESIGMDLSLTEVSPGHFVQKCPCCTG